MVGSMKRTVIADQTMLSPKMWELVQQKLPITTVEVLPVSFSTDVPRELNAIGLILRKTPFGEEERKWALIEEAGVSMVRPSRRP